MWLSQIDMTAVSNPPQTLAKGLKSREERLLEQEDLGRSLAGVRLVTVSAVSPP